MKGGLDWIRGLRGQEHEFARLGMGTISLVGERAKRAGHSQVCSIENRDTYIVQMSFLPFDVS